MPSFGHDRNQSAPARLRACSSVTDWRAQTGGCQRTRVAIGQESVTAANIIEQFPATALASRSTGSTRRRFLYRDRVTED